MALCFCSWFHRGKKKRNLQILRQNISTIKSTCTHFFFFFLYKWPVDSKQKLSGNKLGSLPEASISSHPVVQSLSCVWRFPTPWECQASLSFSISWSLLKLISIESEMSSNHLALCRPLLLLSSIFPTIRVFSNESALCIRLPKYWSFSFGISPSNEYSGFVSFRNDRFALLSVQRMPKSLLQHCSSKESILWHSVFFMVQISHDYWKNHSFE